jgi:hypothetical protein
VTLPTYLFPFGAAARKFSQLSIRARSKQKIPLSRLLLSLSVQGKGNFIFS